MSATSSNNLKTISIRDLIRLNNLFVSKKITSNILTKDPGHFIEVDPNDLEIDHSYQRNLNTRHALSIAEKFDFKNMKIPTGFRVPSTGKILITDGQHTVTAAALAGVTALKVYVHDLPVGVSAADALKMQSQQFLSINLSNKPVSRFDIYRNKLIQQDPEFLKMEAMCQRVGVTPCASKRPDKMLPGAMSHISNMELAWFNICPKASEEAFAFLRKYFPHDAIDGGVFIGLARFIKNMSNFAAIRANAIWDPTVLYKAISQDGTLDMDNTFQSLQDISRNVIGISGNTAAQTWVAKTMREVYNDYVRTNSLTTTQLGLYC